MRSIGRTQDVHRPIDTGGVGRRVHSVDGRDDCLKRCALRRAEIGCSGLLRRERKRSDEKRTGQKAGSLRACHIASLLVHDMDDSSLARFVKPGN